MNWRYAVRTVVQPPEPGCVFVDRSSPSSGLKDVCKLTGLFLVNSAEWEVRDQSVCTQNSVSRLQDAPYEFYLFMLYSSMLLSRSYYRVHW